MDVRVTTEADRITVQVRGDIDLLTAPAVSEYLGQAVDKRPALLVLDWRAVTLLDSSGLRSLLQAQRSCETAGIDLILQPSSPIMRVLKAVGMERMLTPTTSPPGVRLHRQAPADKRA